MPSIVSFACSAMVTFAVRGVRVDILSFTRRCQAQEATLDKLRNSHARVPLHHSAASEHADRNHKSAGAGDARRNRMRGDHRAGAAALAAQEIKKLQRK